MNTESHFRQMIDRVRQGDQQAAVDLMRDYEPHVRRIIRSRLTSPLLRRRMDSVDVCQSVMANFFVRVALGEFEIDTPDQLVRLLATMARNRLLNHVEKQFSPPRDPRKEHGDGDAADRVALSESTPSSLVAQRELLDLVRARLTADEFEIAEARAAGRKWKELGDQRGVSADHVRISYARAITRVLSQIGVDAD